MARKAGGRMEFDALSIEGALLPPEWLSRVATLEAREQAPSDYGVPKGLLLRDEIARYWRIAEALWKEFAAARAAGADPLHAAEHFTEQLCRQVLGFSDLSGGKVREAGGREFRLAFEGLGGAVPIVVAAANASLDDNTTRLGDGSRKRSAWGALQEYLNAADGALWGLSTNGLRLRLGRDNASLTRPAWLEVDLERLFSEERYADFSVLWLMLHASRFGGNERTPEECPLEAWRQEAQSQGSRARDALRHGVEQALLELGQGFIEHPSNESLRAAVAAGELTPTAYFNELLRLIYRMIFLLTVEERGILHASSVSTETAALYRDGYGMRRLRERALRRSAHDRHGDLWTSLMPVFLGLSAPAGEPSLGLAGLGGLFAPQQCADLDRSALANHRLLAAVFNLAWMREGDSLARVNWKDMGVEEFGSIYESLLELVPLVSTDARTFEFAGADDSAGNTRKTTGSYYTPDSLVQQLLDTALEPVVAARLAPVSAGDVTGAEAALLAITVVDPACGSGHFLLAAARRLAGHLARIRAGGTPGAAEYRLALRDVVTHCIHGVDRNPMALELARMALWLEAYTPDRALGFLDHHLQCGDALLGLLNLDALKAGIPDEAFKALTGDDPEIARQLNKLNKQGLKAIDAAAKSGQFDLQLGTAELAEQFTALEKAADDGVSAVESKRARYAELTERVRTDRLTLAADALLAAFLITKRKELGERLLTEQQARERYPTTATVSMALEGLLSAESRVARASRSACEASRVFHWPLAFPQIFSRGGFDVVLGNPPWERIKLQEQEFFASRAPHVASARNAAARTKAIAKLGEAAQGSPERAVHDAFLEAKREAEAASAWCHAEARYPLTGTGDVNTYALFAETMYRATRADGRAGLVVPTGIATDESTKRFFAEVSAGHLISLIDFRTGPGLFSEVGHQRYKFCLLTLGTSAESEFAFSLTAPAQLKDATRRYRLSAADIRLVNPNTLTAPTFRTQYDAELTKKIYRRVPVLIDESKPAAEGNPWGISFLAMFHMSNDSGIFLDAPAKGAVPLYEAKMIHQFDHRWATYERTGSGATVESRDVTDAEKATPGFAVTPRYWVPEEEVESRLRALGWSRAWYMGWRRICRSTDERTLISCVIPRVGVGDSLFLWMFGENIAPREAAGFLGTSSSLVLDYVARQKIGGTNLSYYYMRQLPFLRPTDLRGAAEEFLVPRIAELTCHASTSQWASDLGISGSRISWNPDRRAVVRAEVDAYVACLYGLSRDELRYVLDPADLLGPNHPSETFRVLRTNEERRFGEYRTRRLVLEAWDRLFG